MYVAEVVGVSEELCDRVIDTVVVIVWLCVGDIDKLALCELDCEVD